MNRLLTLQTALLAFIDAQEGLLPERDEPLSWERLHMASSARLAWLMAEERGEDPCLAACACSVHDFGRILTGRTKDHAQAGYKPVQEFLSGLALFSATEIETIAYVVAHHSEKSETGSLLEEIIKDADVVDCHQYGVPLERDEQQERYLRWSHRHALR